MYEEKYKNALKKTKQEYNNTTDSERKQWLEELFPELKESEDEKIKKAILNYFIKCWGNCKDDVCGIHVEDVIDWLEKQDKSKKYTFKSIPRLLDMIEPTERAKAYTKKLINTLTEEGYITDAKIVEECLKQMNGEDVAMAVMDEKQGEEQETLCDKCKKEQPSHSCQDITALGRCAIEKQNGQKPTHVLDINIPCSAKDSELQEAFYHIPEGFNAEIEGNRVVIKQGEQKPKFVAKKEVIGVLKEMLDNIDPVGLEETKKEMMEAMPTDKVEPKFKVGDWVVFNNKHQSIYQVEKIENGYYILRHTHGGSFRVCVLHDESLRLWSIKDAKDGDVLYSKEHNLLWLHKNSKQCHSCINLNYNNNISIGTDIVIPSDVHPATKEQRDLLFAKMKELGYKLDPNNKKVSKI